MPHVILLGDSIFDNGRYTGGKPDVVTQVQGRLPSGWSASLLAVDGSVTADVAAQMQRLPSSATHLVLSVGGNDAIMNSSRLGFSLFGFGCGTPSTQDPLQVMAEVSQEFAKSYRLAIDACLQPHLPLVVCTIYNCCFPDANYQRLITTGLTVFNDAILGVAIERRLPVIDLRLICSEPQDYANAIEPSSVGGEKIARAIVAAVATPGDASCRTRVFA
jgi:hypothetical protein